MAGILFFALALATCPAPFALLAAVAVHEAGHIIAAALLGFGPPSFSFSAAGLKLSWHAAKPLFPSLAVCLSGSFAGLIFAAVSPRDSAFCLYSFGFAFVNLLPISGLDGGGALLALLESFVLPDRAYKAAKCICALCVLFLWAVSAAVQLKAGTNLTLLALSVYLTVMTFSDGS